jgi:rare lipoprotein A
MIIAQDASPGFKTAGRKLLFAVTALAFLATGCAETQFLAHQAKKARKPAPIAQGEYKVGKPYKIKGIWYYPKINYEYNETGIASWYGPGFHGKPTANGETFNQGALSAAHRTLPLPSLVQVTNLENGRSIQVRVNDRGPFSNGRIIDLSKRAAGVLGFLKKGTAKVRVQVLETESRQLAALASRSEANLDAPEAAPVVEVSSVSLSDNPSAQGSPSKATYSGAQTAVLTGNSAVVADTGYQLESDLEPLASKVEPQLPNPVPDNVVRTLPVTPTDIFVQAGAFSLYHNALRLRAELSSMGQVHLSQTKSGQTTLFRVRFGPMTNVAEADKLLDRLIANGYDDARVVVD